MFLGAVFIALSQLTVLSCDADSTMPGAVFFGAQSCDYTLTAMAFLAAGSVLVLVLFTRRLKNARARGGPMNRLATQYFLAELAVGLVWAAIMFVF